MTEAAKPSSPAATPDEAKKRWRERLDKLLAQPPCRSEASMKFGDRTLKYHAIAEFIPVLATGIDDKRGEPEAAIFTTSYFASGADPATRPVCFAFNGGPGSSSVWLHLGALGPRRVQIPEDGTMPAPPYAVCENPQSWLEHFDLVFIDPAHTGFSTTASEEARKKALSADGDAAILTECIRTWLGRHRRWNSPIYLVGESYGTTRGAIIADKLPELGIALSGLILVSCAMDFQCLHFQPCNDLPYVLFLPGYACVAQYHGMLKGRQAESPACRSLHRRGISGGTAGWRSPEREPAAQCHQADGGAHRAEREPDRSQQPAHQRCEFLRRAAARSRPDRRPPRGARHGADGRQPHARL